jgi:uncharacterized membrane protein
VQFLTSVLFIAAFGVINFLNQNKEYVSVLREHKGWNRIVNAGLPAVFLLAIFISFRIEIQIYWNQLFLDSGTVFVNRNKDLLKFETISLISFSILYFSILLLVNIRRIKSNLLAIIAIHLSVVTIFVFLTQGLFELSELRERYLNSSSNNIFVTSSINLWIRYVCFALAGGLLGLIWKQLLQSYVKMNLKIPFELFFHISMVWIISSELIHWMDIMQATQTYKLGLSILWGLYSLWLVAFGIWKGKKYLRIGAIVLFAVTLIKLFTYDLSSLDTIAKTIVFVSLGILLLIISFLYNKYKGAISTEGER